MLELIIQFFSRFVSFFLSTSGANSFPPSLKPEEEARLFKRYAEGDRAARAVLIERNLRLVAHIVKKYYSASPEKDDLISIGTVGLIKAIDSFDATKGARFATYAGKCVQNEILMFFRSQKKTACETSMNEPVDTDKEGNVLTYIDILPTEDTTLDEIDAGLRATALYKAIREALTMRERQVILMRSGLQSGKPLPQREVAAKMGISRSYVSRIEKNALEKLKVYLQRAGIDAE